VDQRIYDADLKGTFKEEGNKFVAHVEGKYKYYLIAGAEEKINIDKAHVSGTFIFEKTAKGVTIKDMKIM
jgi:hypothetical protein